MESRHGTCPSCHHEFPIPTGSRRESACPQCGAAVPLARSAASAGAKGARPAAARARAGAHGARKGAAREDDGFGSSSSAHARALASRNKSSRTGPLLALGGAGIVAGILAFVILQGGDETEASTTAPEPVVGVDLAQLPDPPRLEGTEDGEWDTMTELMTRYVTPPFDANAQRSGDLLMIHGKRSVPVILSAFKRLDLTKQDAADIGWKIQTLLLQGQCGDTNFGWHKQTQPQDVAFNQRVIQRWLESWAKAGANDEAWAEIRASAAAPSAPGK